MNSVESAITTLLIEIFDEVGIVFANEETAKNEAITVIKIDFFIGCLLDYFDKKFEIAKNKRS